MRSLLLVLAAMLIAFLFLITPCNAFVQLSRPGQPHTASIKSMRLLAVTSDTCDVAVFGGGFGGLYTALAMARQAKQQKKSLDIVLVEPTDTFIFLPLLYDLTVGTATESEVCPAYTDLLQGTGVRHVQASLSSLVMMTSSNSQSSRACATLQPATTLAPTELTFRSAVVSVGASPTDIMRSVPGALEYAQPFYTNVDAKATRRLLARFLEQQQQQPNPVPPRIAIIGGGFGGVELAASVKRKIPSASVSLLSRGAPMSGTKAEPLVDMALEKLGVTVEQCSVESIDVAASILSNTNDSGVKPPVTIQRRKWGDDESLLDMDPWDVALWTAGSRPASPVANNGLAEFRTSESGRLATDSTLRCFLVQEVQLQADIGMRTVKTVKMDQQPAIWALGDCAEIVSIGSGPAVPKTAQAAMQQAEIVACNVLAELQGKQNAVKKFQYQDLGNMLTLGGPNGAVIAPSEGVFAPFLGPLLETAGKAFEFTDKMMEATVGRPPLVDTLGLSLGSYGIGVDAGAAPGTLAGTLTGAARRAVYAARMPTNRQRVVAVTSAAISTAVSLAKEASSNNQK